MGFLIDILGHHTTRPGYKHKLLIACARNIIFFYSMYLPIIWHREYRTFLLFIFFRHLSRMVLFYFRMALKHWMPNSEWLKGERSSRSHWHVLSMVTDWPIWLFKQSAPPRCKYHIISIFLHEKCKTVANYCLHLLFIYPQFIPM